MYFATLVVFQQYLFYNIMDRNSDSMFKFSRVIIRKINNVKHI